MKPRSLLLFLLLSTAVARLTGAATLASFRTSVGNMELELFDEDKPVTVSNFVKYVTSGEFTNLFVQRWEPNFVIQAGGYRVTNTTSGTFIEDIVPFGNITNEYNVGKIYSNTYGTIAMARQSKVTNSASSQWFLNLTNNAFLDSVDGGFTVFGHVTAGTNVLNLFVPPPPTKGIYRVNLGEAALTTVPVTGNVTNISQLWTNLVYIDISLRRDVNLFVSSSSSGQRTVSWTSVSGVKNTLQYASGSAPSTWLNVTNFVGTGSAVSVLDTSTDRERIYRVTLTY